MGLTPDSQYVVKYWRVCVDCEVKLREKALEEWPCAAKEGDPTDAERFQVENDLHVAQKEAWATKAERIRKANENVQNAEASGAPSNSQRNTAIF